MPGFADLARVLDFTYASIGTIAKKVCKIHSTSTHGLWMAALDQKLFVISLCAILPGFGTDVNDMSLFTKTNVLDIFHNNILSGANMTSRELIKKSLRFEAPERIPRQIGVLPWAMENYPEEVKKIQADFPDDIVTAPVIYKRSPEIVGDWGCIFENRQKGIIGEVKESLLKSRNNF